MVRSKLVAAFLVLVAKTTPALAADANADFLLKLFTNACIPNVQHPEGVRAWAADHRLVEIKSPDALSVYVGAGDGGALWAVPAQSGMFALSLRAGTKQCAVWAGAADPDQVSIGLKTVTDGLKRSGLDVAILRENNSETQLGTRHGLVYLVSAPDAPSGVTFTMITNERPGGAYQATLQVGRISLAK